MIQLRKILKIHSINNFIVECEMENGEIYRYDMSYIHEKNGEMVLPLKDGLFFEKVFLEFGCLTWPNGFDVDPNVVAAEGELIKKSA